MNPPEKRLKMMTLLQLDYFRKLAATEHITKTATELHITQTALSYMIGNLEKELGVKLFDRAKRRVWLNEEGRVFLKYVNDIFTSLENGRAALQDISSSKEQVIRLAAGTSSVWAPLFRDFCKAYPHHTLKQTNHTISQMEKALAEKTVDFVLAGENDLRVSGMEKTWIKTDDIYLCVSPMHPLANRESVYLKELQDEHFIDLNATMPWRAYCDQLFALAGFKPHVVLECDYTLRASLIESNFGVALTSASAREVDLLRPNRYIRIADSYAHRKMYLYYNPDRYMTQAAKDFLELCVGYYKDEA
jgi:DNA-binding transcriptional LysR family regulator